MTKWLKQVWKRVRSHTADQHGFTLIELAVALAVLGILIAIAVPTYLNVRNRSYDSEAKQILGEIRSMAWSYYLENDKFPEDLTTLKYNVSDDVKGRWEISLNGGGDSAEIKATGKGKATNGRCWSMKIDQQGQATLAGPECNS